MFPASSVIASSITVTGLKRSLHHNRVACATGLLFAGDVDSLGSEEVRPDFQRA